MYKKFFVSSLKDGNYTYSMYLLTVKVGFDRVTLFGILQRSDGPARHELLLKLLFPPFRVTKERQEFVRDVLETSSAEFPQYVAKFFVFIHSCSTSRVCAFPVARARA